MTADVLATLRVPNETFPTVLARQHTLKSSIDCVGTGLHSGARVGMTLHPADPDTGIRFVRTDVAGQGRVIPALWSQVGDTRMNTSLVSADHIGVGTVEHLMSALAGTGVDNCLIEINGPEVPVMDGSSAPFVFLIECAGLVEQDRPRRAIRVLKRVAVRDGDRAMASLTPSTGFSVRFEIDFKSQAIARQDMFINLGRGSFKTDIARARTFGFEHEVAALRAAGLARGGSLDNAVVIDSTGTRVLNDDGLRYPDEFVRHKVLDAVGDLYLAGAPLIGHFHGVRSGHALNNQILRALLADETAWCWDDEVFAAPRLAASERRYAAAV
jgi:UDP-3-O-[3-hydroxymyristoyl] N-acetylglucosamine deacetylase